MAVDHFPRRAGKRCENPVCGQVFRSLRRPKTARYCSRQCAADCRPRAARVASGRKGGTASGIKRRGESKRTIEQRLQGLTVAEAFLLGRKYGKADMGNQRTAARREGFADGFEKGYDTATKEIRWRA